MLKSVIFSSFFSNNLESKIINLITKRAYFIQLVKWEESLIKHCVNIIFYLEIFFQFNENEFLKILVAERELVKTHQTYFGFKCREYQSRSQSTTIRVKTEKSFKILTLSYFLLFIWMRPCKSNWSQGLGFILDQKNWKFDWSSGSFLCFNNCFQLLALSRIPRPLAVKRSNLLFFSLLKSSPQFFNSKRSSATGLDILCLNSLRSTFRHFIFVTFTSKF